MNHQFDFNKQDYLKASLETHRDTQNPKYFKFKIGDYIAVLHEPEGVNDPAVKRGMKGRIRDYVPIVPLSDGKARSYYVEFESNRGKEFITHEENIDLEESCDPEQFRIT